MKSPIVKSAFIVLLAFCLSVTAYAVVPNVVSITRVSTEYTVNNTITFKVTFDIPVEDFDDAGDIALAGSAGGITFSQITPVSTTVYDVEVTVTTPGTVTIQVNANAAEEAGAGTDKNPASAVSPTITYTILPTVTTDAVAQARTENSATLGGSVDDDGGSTVNERGVVYKTSSNVGIGDNKTPAGAGGTGSFTVPIAGLTAGTQYFYRAYAENEAEPALGPALGTEFSFWTLETEPASSPATVNATGAGFQAIHIEFPLLTTIPSAHGYLIIRQAGSAPETGDVTDGVAPASAVGSGSVFVTNYTGTNNFYDDTSPSLVPGTVYYYAVIPYRTAGSDESYRYRKTGGFTSDITATWAQESDIHLNAAAAGSLDYELFQSPTITTVDDNDDGDGNNNEGVVMAEFIVRDGGSTHGDDDFSGTELATLQLTFDFPQFLRAVALRKDGAIISEEGAITTIPGTGVINFTFDDADDAVVAADDNNSTTLRVLATFDETVTDLSVMRVRVTGATTHSGSGMLTTTPFATATTGTTNNKIDVDITQLEIFDVTATPININQDFSLSVRPKDGLGNIDLDAANVSLSESESGTLSSVTGLTNKPFNSSGVMTWTDLRWNLAGQDKTIRANVGGVEAFVDVDILSPGISITGPNGASATYCLNSLSNTASSTFEPLSQITITEADVADFADGDNQTFALMLPSGFIFDTSSPPVVTGSSSTNISGTQAHATPFTGNNIVRVEYDINGVDEIDQLRINGLKVKYIGTSIVTNQKIIRIGGTAIQSGNSETDDKSHGLLSSKNGPTTVDFENTNGGGISPTETRFHVTSNPIILQGKAGGVNISGVFSGDGVLLDNDGRYKFHPQQLDEGQYQITFVNTESTGAMCRNVVTKTFEVFNTIINGLPASVCYNSPVTMTGPVTPPPAGNCITGPQYEFYDYFYYDYGNTYGFIPIPAPNDVFDPSNPIYSTSISLLGQVYIGYRLKRNCSIIGGPLDPPFIQPWEAQWISVVNPPTVSMSAIPLKVCEYDAEFDLIGFPAPQNNGFDEFWASAAGNPASPLNGVSGDAVSGFTFDPSDGINSSSAPIVVRVNYQYRNEATGCSNTVFRNITVNPRPPLVPTSDIFIRNTEDTSGEFCKDEVVTEFSATPTAGVAYKWYTNPITTTVSEGDSYLPVVPNVPGTYQFNITQTQYRSAAIPLFGIPAFAGCESDPRLLSVEIVAPQIVDIASTATICGGAPLELDDVSGSVTPGALGGTWKSASTIQGDFEEADGDPSTILGPAEIYQPTIDEINAGGFTLVLTSGDPAGPCGPISDEVFITINPGAVIEDLPANFDVCAGERIRFSADVTVAGGEFTWTESGGGNIEAGTANLESSEYTPSATELQNGAVVTITLTTDDPDDGGPCESVDGSFDVTIHQRAYVDAGPDFTVCSDQPVVLNGSIPAASSANTITWTENGAGSVVDAADENSAYLPAPAELTAVTSVTFTITSDVPSAFCPAETDQVTVTINPKPAPPDPIAPRNYCVGDAVELLRATGIDLTWYSDPALTSQLSVGPSLATGVLADTDKQVPFYVTQTHFKSGTFAGCESDATTMTVIVNPLPVPSFTTANFCLGDMMQFTNTSTLKGEDVGDRSVTGYRWIFDDDLALDLGIGAIPAGQHEGLTEGDFKDPRHRYEKVGQYNVRLQVMTSDNCTAQYTSPTISVGPVPVADFRFLRVCDQDDTRFNYTGTEVGAITSWSWEFGDPSTGASDLSAIPNPTHRFSGVNTFDVTLNVQTNLGCQDQVIKKVSILPYIQTFPYVQDFEGTHGWVSEGLNNNGFNSWTQLTSAGEISAKPVNQPNFWATYKASTGTYDINERSVLNAPCINVSNLDRPVLSFDYWNSTEPGSDGAYIEYSIDPDAQVWNVLGNTSEGLEWYNRTSIQGLATQNGVGQNVGQVGWSGKDNTWKTGKYNLDALSGETKVRFRYVFGSNPSAPLDGTILNGFAIDYFKLETRNRLVLVEHFTNSNAPQSASNITAFNAFPTAAASDEVVKIQYHTAFPGVDQINTQNPVDPSARSAFYGVTTAPKAYVDGYSNLASGGSFLGNWAREYYNRQSLVTSPVEITVNNPVSNNGSLEISGSVLAREMAVKANEYSLYIAVVERQVGTNTYVLRKMLPTAAGQKLPAIALNGSSAFNASWVIDQSYVSDPTQLSVIAFVQADAAGPSGYRQILQAAINNNMPAINFNTGVDATLVEQITVFPNPADHELNVLLPGPAKSAIDVRVLDQMGKPVMRSKVKAGDVGTTISTRDLAASVYIVQFEEAGKISHKKVVITH